MAKRSIIEREKKRRALVKLMWDRRQKLKETIRSPMTSPEDRTEAQLTLNKMPRNSSVIRLRNRCALTGRPRGYIRKFKLSRLCFREMASQGLIPGVVKASW